MGGLGKTTLAQLIYNDPRIKEHFKLQRWVCVSEDFNIGQLIKSLFESVDNIPIENLELLQRRLREVIGAKRYIIVLDDVWNEKDEDWEMLRTILNCGDSGSVVVVTTRNDKVASVMGTVESYSLGCLGEEDSWSLFSNRAFRKGVKKCQELVEIGLKLVRKCQGVPLAINALGSLMSCQHEVREWLAILDKSNTWETGPTKQVLQVLRLSYDHLPLYMKQCFAFCAVFPKDYEIDKEELIQFWMANGFIESREKGNDIFDELSSGSFFQEVRQVVPICAGTFRYGLEDGYPSQTKCKMHDLMHDLAQSVTGGECLSLLKIPTQQNMSDINIRHVSLKYLPLDINEIMGCFPSIRSLISSVPYLDYVKNIGFLKPNALRILKLGTIIPTQRVLLTPENLKYLRFLEIQDYEIKSLPEAISNMYLLQTLRLSGCFSLKKLPEGLRYMSRLRHLHIEECFRLQSMPSGLGQLSSLQTLTTYVLGADAGNSIAELKTLNLYGKLHIYNLREVRDVADAREANLVAKENLDDLLLCWETPFDYDNIRYMKQESNAVKAMHRDPFQVLDALNPSNKLKVLGVAFYEGDKFPVWATEYHMLKNLTELRIMECRECTNIPPVEKLPILRILELNHLDNLRYLYSSSSTECGEEAQIVFPALEQLLLSEMPNLCSWCEGEAADKTSLTIPKLKRLDIVNCHKLTAMPIVSSLQKLFVEGNRVLSCFAIRLTTVQKLKISLGNHDRDAEGSIKSLSFQPWETLEDLSLTGYNSIVPIGANEEVTAIVTKCQHLTLTSCNLFLSHIPSNSSLWFWKCFTFLERLNIWECDSLIFWPEEEFRSLNCLNSIWVSKCSEFLGSQQESPAGRSITEVLLPKLEDLWISDCAKLTEVPKLPASIRKLEMNACPNLECLPEWLGSMVALEWLEIEECETLNSLPLSIGGLTSLRTLQIIGCPKLATLPEGMQGLKALKKLEIKKCPKIRVLHEGLLQQLKHLDNLWIEGCPHLERHFRKDGKYQRLISAIPYAVIGDGRRFGVISDLALSIPSFKVTCLSAQS